MCPNCGRRRRRRRRRRRKTNCREGRQRILSVTTQLDLSISQLEKIKDQSCKVLEDRGGKHWITNVHNSPSASISQCHLSLKDCSQPLHLKPHFLRSSLRLCHNLSYLCWYCGATDHSLFITVLVQSSCLQIPRGSVDVRWETPCETWPGVSGGVCRSNADRCSERGDFSLCALPLLDMCRNTHRLHRYTQPPHDAAHARPSQLSSTGGVIRGAWEKDPATSWRNLPQMESLKWQKILNNAPTVKTLTAIHSAARCLYQNIKKARRESDEEPDLLEE